MLAPFVLTCAIRGDQSGSRAQRQSVRQSRALSTEDRLDLDFVEEGAGTNDADKHWLELLSSLELVEAKAKMAGSPGEPSDLQRQWCISGYSNTWMLSCGTHLGLWGHRV